MLLKDHFISYERRLAEALNSVDWDQVERLAVAMQDSWFDKSNVFLCGNGGSAGNANHIANDFIYGVASHSGHQAGLKIQSLSANSSVITCLANDEGYEKIYSEQLLTLGTRGDLLIALSGSGNSQNIVEVLLTAKQMGIKTAAVLGFDGGSAKGIADIPIHFPVYDMQISEDLQMLLSHGLMQWLMLKNAR